MQEIKCKICGKTLCQKEHDEIILVCKRCSQNVGESQYRSIDINELNKNQKAIIKI